MCRSSSAYTDFDTFFRESLPDMLARALALTRSRHDAEDAVQEAYVEALCRWDRISGYDNPGAWVYKIACQRLWKTSKRWARLRPVSLDDAIVQHAGGTDPQRFTEARMALSALADLPARQRMVMVMHCLHRMEQQQIADELGLTRGAVAASIFKARRKLEKALGMRDTDLATAPEPGSAMAGPDAAAAAGGITRERDPLTATLDSVLAWLRQLTSSAGRERQLDRIHRDARARANRTE